jgi:glutathionyl-hydroquinone reductase
MSASTGFWEGVPGGVDSDERGRFVRRESAFRRRVSNEPGAEFPAEPGRYHLYASLGCPWAARTVTVRALKGLEDVVGLSIVDPIRDIRGWAFREAPGATGDPINGFEYLAEAYERTLAGYDDRVSVPVLWDRESEQIVNNESSEIIVMLNDEFNEWARSAEVDLYPPRLRPEIDEINDWVYGGLNNGVYRAGFASSQEAYDEAVGPVFETLERMDSLLARRRYLAGAQHTLADWRAFPTLMRFDLVYHGLFRCNRRRLIDYENLWPYTRDLYQTPGVAATVDFDHFVRGYNLNLPQLNPAGIVPIGPDLDFLASHGRERLG